MKSKSFKKETLVIKEILEKAKDSPYLGEKVSQYDHSIQCAYFAEKAWASNDLIVAALLHDIGHYCPGSKKDYMNGLGSLDHENIGANFLKSLHMKDEVTELIRHHVLAKRYLVYKNRHYLRNLSKASEETLELQGGPMTEKEAKSFQQHTYFKNILKLRQFDELGKGLDLHVPPLEHYLPYVDDAILSPIVEGFKEQAK